MVAIGAIVAVLAPAISYFFGWLFDLPPGAVAGLLAGSNNSSATFGTASSALSVGRFPSAIRRHCRGCGGNALGLVCSLL